MSNIFEVEGRYVIMYSELLTHGQKWQTPVEGVVREAKEHGEAEGDYYAHADGADASPGQLSSLKYEITEHFAANLDII